MAEKEKAEKKADEKPSDSQREAAEKAKELRRAKRQEAARAKEIAESGGDPLGSAITVPQLERIVAGIGEGDPIKFFKASPTELIAYAQTGKGKARSDLNEDATTALRDFCRSMGDRRIWPRKVAAVALMMDEQLTGRARPGTRPKTSQAAEDDGKEASKEKAQK